MIIFKDTSCKECGKVCESMRSLHAHLKAHDMFLGDYYTKHFPKKDLFTQEPIPFKNIEQYQADDFRSKHNMYMWLDSCNPSDAAKYCKDVFDFHILTKEYQNKFAPDYLYLRTHPRLPKIEYFNKYLDYKQLCEDNKLQIVKTKLPNFNIFQQDIDSEITIMQDTREQQPLTFSFPSIKRKLDFGDYALEGKDYNYIFVDRKSEGDFKSTVTSGYDRFRQELNRVRHFNSYLFVVIESDFHQIYKNKKGTNLVYVWECMRDMIIDYSDVCQFVFTSNRANSSSVIPKLLFFGQHLKLVDIQNGIEELAWLG